MNKYPNCNITECRGGYGNTMLHCAAQSGKIEMVNYFLARGFDVNKRNNLSETPLHLAAGFYTKGTVLKSFSNIKASRFSPIFVNLNTNLMP